MFRLDPDVCEKCLARHGIDQGTIERAFWLRWNARDCLGYEIKMHNLEETDFTLSYSIPPGWCNYIMEHTVSQDEQFSESS